MGNIKQNKIMSDEDNEFIKGENAGSAVGVVEAGRAKPGTLVMMKETFPCKVTAMIVAKDIFTDKTEYLLLDLDDDQLTLMHQESGDVREDIDLPTVSHLSDIVKLIKKIHTTGKK